DPADHRAIILTSDGHRDLLGRAVGASDGEGVGDAVAGFKGLDLGLAVVELVAPLAVLVEAELPIGAGRAGLGNEVSLAIVGIRHDQLASGELT
ncbi:hypothetical protein RI497_00020, partial [Aeromonas veronii]